MIHFIALATPWLFYFLGLQFLIFGLNGFFHFLPLPPSPKGIEKFMQALQESQFALAGIKIFEIIGGLFCLFETTRPFGLIALGPIVFHIVGLHWVFHRKKFWIIGLQVLLPFTLAVMSCADRFLRLLNV